MAPGRPRAYPMSMVGIGTALLLPVLALAGGADSAAKTLAKAIGKACAKARVEVVEVRPFRTASDRVGPAGAELTDALLRELMRRGEPEVAGGDPLSGEYRTPDALVLTAYTPAGDEILARVRVISHRTGQVLEDRQVSLDNVWKETIVAARAVDDDRLRDDGSCAGAARRIDGLERSMLEEKARYWALYLERRGMSLEQLVPGPQERISDPALRAQFEDIVRHWREGGRVPELTPSELSRFRGTDRQAFELYAACSYHAQGKGVARR